ncbi:DUF4349 domain-containing protein [Flavobacterium coralii]|uniref:DUF4349 domain-containing protein n=1 Tax=Flavobacterium coralii TaxID=2838017 RepID=UPI000C50105E|nr:hypothetical protein [Flavobacterium sp.]|tara:strand:+ start:99926 stop:100762 length:837 start_codon:yes stop_codon:yes gene_type:complete
MKITLFCTSLLMLVGGCSENAPVTDNITLQEVAVEAPAMEEIATNVDDKAYSGTTDTEYRQMLIKNANLAFETDDLEATAKRINAAAQKFGAQLQSDSESNNGYSLSRTLVLRIPGNKFDLFIDEVAKGVTYFDRKEISAQDVTEEYVDLDARIKAKKTLEARYLELLKKANKVSEMLEIEKELSAIREEIEAHEGRLRYLKSRVAMSTVVIEFYKHTEQQAGATVSYGSKMWNAIKSGFNGISTFFIGVLYLWPFILIFVIVFILIRKRIRKKSNKI